MRKSSLFIRFLSSSILIYDLATLLEKYKARIFFGVPLKVAMSDKVLALHEIQNRGFRAFVFLKIEVLDSLLELVRISRIQQCESVWVESLPEFQVEVLKQLHETLSKNEFKKIRCIIQREKLSVVDDKFCKQFSNITYI